MQLELYFFYNSVSTGHLKVVAKNHLNENYVLPISN